MGMFSWICVGCGQELTEGEKCRMDGCVGTYDGYGRCGHYDHNDSDGEPVAWHEWCYQHATEQARASKTPSKSAPNQGFGFSHLRYLPGYKSDAPTKYVVAVDPIIEGSRAFFYLTVDGWKDQEAWNTAAYELDDNREEGSPAGTSPEKAAIQFDTIDLALAAATAAKLPTSEQGYTLTVFGRQNNSGGRCGMVYEFRRTRDYKFTRTDGGMSVIDLGTYTEQVYDIRA